ncbi:hypothetical protein CHS0354_028231 [Potamilus streckersoni]|uniref:Uncharacterized protein n=1 Tax=Potamilus streckersoni TaxID=2493646 RepID=A0AAE0VIE7_9BIVA|nr:hypothetical protein CHS0354_028231 [Potamilus streckersoni]
MDVPRECSLQHLLELVMNTYFPGGKSEEQNLEVADLNMFVASFSGRPLPEVIGEKSFTVGTYFDSLKSYPVRIYLHTKKKEQADASSTEQVANSTGTDDLTDTGTPTIVFNERPRRRRLLELVSSYELQR